MIEVVPKDGFVLGSIAVPSLNTNIVAFSEDHKRHGFVIQASFYQCNFCFSISQIYISNPMIC